jgi:hypothetical protein
MNDRISPLRLIAGDMPIHPLQASSWSLSVEDPYRFKGPHRQGGQFQVSESAFTRYFATRDGYSGRCHGDLGIHGDQGYRAAADAAMRIDTKAPHTSPMSSTQPAYPEAAISEEQELIYGPLGVGTKQRRFPVLGFGAQLHFLRCIPMNELLDRILGDPNLGLTATARIILLHLAQSPAGARIEDIALSTGSKYRWIETKASELARAGILRRVSPNTYAINSDREVQK